MQVGDHKKTFKLILHTHVVSDGTKVVSQVQISGGPDPTHYDRFLLLHKVCEDKEWERVIKRGGGIVGWLNGFIVLLFYCFIVWAEKLFSC